MPNKPLVHVILPQLFQPLRLWKKGHTFEVASHYLTQLFQSYSVAKKSNNGLNTSLFSSIGFDTQKELPVAYYRYQAHCNEVPLSNGQLLCADPVNLVVGMSDITLMQQIKDLTKFEAKELIDLLNNHFEQDGMTFFIGSNSQWYLSVDGIEDLTTTPIEDVIRKNIAHYPLISSSNERNWQALQNEIQMLLHSAPLNQQREVVGLPVVNSLWFWGGGRSQTIENNASLILSNNSIAGKMIAVAAGCDYKNLEPSNNKNDFSKIPKGKTIIINDSLIEPAINDDLNAYQAELDKVDAETIKPLFELWKTNRISLIIDSCDGQLITPSATPSWKFWKKVPSSLVELDL